jgi:hypothetical protein
MLTQKEGVGRVGAYICLKYTVMYLNYVLLEKYVSHNLKKNCKILIKSQVFFNVKCPCSFDYIFPCQLYNI